VRVPRLLARFIVTKYLCCRIKKIDIYEVIQVICQLQDSFSWRQTPHKRNYVDSIVAGVTISEVATSTLAKVSGSTGWSRLAGAAICVLTGYLLVNHGFSESLTKEASDLKSELDLWVARSSVGENREEAAERIFKAFCNRSITLDLKGLGLTSLPAGIGRLTELKGLDLDYNRLKTLPSEIGGLTSLAHLELKGNLLQRLPHEIEQLTELTYLGLAENQIKNLPQEITQLTKLRWLILSENQLERLPKEIGSLTSLIHLDLGGNKLCSFPSEMKNLTALEVLFIFGGEFRSAPHTIPFHELWAHGWKKGALGSEDS
jgi:Leucine rich repeat